MRAPPGHAAIGPAISPSMTVSPSPDAPWSLLAAKFAIGRFE
jgi:hypothetical protein